MNGKKNPCPLCGAVAERLRTVSLLIPSSLVRSGAAGSRLVPHVKEGVGSDCENSHEALYHVSSRVLRYVVAKQQRTLMDRSLVAGTEYARIVTARSVL